MGLISNDSPKIRSRSNADPAVTYIFLAFHTSCLNLFPLYILADIYLIFIIQSSLDRLVENTMKVPHSLLNEKFTWYSSERFVLYR